MGLEALNEELELSSPASMVTGEDLDDAFTDENMETAFTAAVDGVPAEDVLPVEAVVEDEVVEDAVVPAAVEISEKLPAAESEAVADMQAQMAEMQKKLDDAEKATAADAVAAEAAAAGVETADTYVDPTSALSDEQREALSRYENDWPEIHAAETINRDIMASRVGTIIQQMTNYFESKMGTMAAQMEAMQGGVEHTQLASKVDDLDTVMVDVTNWVAKQPAFLQPGYQAVVNSGTPEQKLELIDLYRGAVQDTTIKVVAKAPKAKPNTDSLTPVISKRSALPSSNNIDEADMEGAFKDALSKL